MTTNVAVCIENAKEAINDCLNGAPAAERRELLAGALRSLAKAQDALGAQAAPATVATSDQGLLAR